MVAVTDEQIQAEHDRIAALRDKVTEKKYSVVENVAQVQREVELAQLQAESARLEAELAVVGQGSSLKEIRDANAPSLQNAKDMLAAAKAISKQAGGDGVVSAVVDTAAVVSTATSVENATVVDTAKEGNK